MTTANTKKLSRRKFFQRGAIVLGGVIVATYLGRGVIRRFAAQLAEDMDAPALIANNESLIWFEILPDNTVLIKSPKIEMGQGIFTGFAMLAAEELDVSLNQIKVIHANTADGPVDRISTGGSSSTSSLYKSIREMAAYIREMLKETAAKKWSVSVFKVNTQDGILSSEAHKITYADLAKSTIEWEEPATPELRPASQFKFVGKEVKRTDLRPKVFGEPIYAIDQSLPDMVYATLLQSPYIEAIIRHMEIKEALKQLGVIRVIQEEDLVAVIAKNRYAAEKGLEKIRVEWDIPEKWQQAEIEKLTKVGVGNEVSVQKVGSAKGILKENNDEVFTEQYRTSIGAHAHMEPNGAIANYHNGKLKIIIGTQAPDLLRKAVASALDLSVDDVEIELTFAGGAFGRRMDTKLAIGAARISKIIGKPVQLFNTREQEFLNGVYRPQTHHVLAAKISQTGAVEAVTHDQATPDQIFAQIPADLGPTVFGADFISAGHGASIMYNVENKAATMWHNKLPIEVGIWRGVGMFANTFAIESFFNELAYKTSNDPIAFRIELLQGKEKINQRCVKVLETLREKSEWNQTKAGGIGRGMAICNDRKTISAVVAEVKVMDKKIQVVKITQVIDAGLAINPDGIRMQVEGATMMGITAALYEEIIIEDARIINSNFDKYPMVTLADTPKINVVIVEGEVVPLGVGEPPLSPVAPAIAAAVFDLTGQRLRSLPMKLS
ncbi:molybdopterin cofactor-binding domain-containing protein [Emticicia sp. C21]|uniref:xanthine dehydrogenase family protein molybdopterin-binding subunit n=1 Tax=Emticicia sp. C21 TaxID=2302915 RepID=UPI000E348CB3|nr:molybdopterin cofactor-binding domain-containing protein [Emticicia sp. C21]RFS14549.1 xanthine dehydrogenase family protein molybdopterin-binding subunit [Emticicia sp. C21]